MKKWLNPDYYPDVAARIVLEADLASLRASLTAAEQERGRLVEESVELLQSERKLQARVETLASERKALTARLTASEAALKRTAEAWVEQGLQLAASEAAREGLQMELDAMNGR